MNSKKPQGFSLLELLTTLTIISILASLSLPALSSLIDKNRAYHARNSIASGLSFTRTHAIMTQQQTEMCGSSDGQNCDHQWSLGWLIRLPKTTEPLASEQFNSLPGSLSWGRPESTIRFMSNGTSPTSNSYFLYCTDTNNSWRMVINRQGRVRTALNKDDAGCS